MNLCGSPTEVRPSNCCTASRTPATCSGPGAGAAVRRPRVVPPGPVELDIAHATINGSGRPIEVGALYVGADQSLVRECWILMLAMITVWRREPGARSSQRPAWPLAGSVNALPARAMTVRVGSRTSFVPCFGLCSPGPETARSATRCATRWAITGCASQLRCAIHRMSTRPVSRVTGDVDARGVLVLSPGCSCSDVPLQPAVALDCIYMFC